MTSDSDSKPTTTTGPGLKKDFPAATYEEWRKAAEALLKGAPFEKVLNTRTYEGVELRPIYNAEDTKDLPHLERCPDSAAFPGDTGPTAVTTSPGRYRRSCPAALRRNSTRPPSTSWLVVRPSSISWSTSPPRPVATRMKPASGEVGACGVSLATLADMEKAFEGINLPMISIYLRAGSFAVPVTALLLAYARKQGIDYGALRGCIEIDPLGNLAWKGDLPVSLDLAYHEMATITRFAEEAPTTPDHHRPGPSLP